MNNFLRTVFTAIFFFSLAIPQASPKQLSSDVSTPASVPIQNENRTVQAGLLGMRLPENFLAFSIDSPWNTPLPDNPKLHPDSGKMISELANRAEFLKADSSTWSVPLFVIDSRRAQRRTIHAASEPFHPTLDPKKEKMARSIPVPEGVWPDPMADGHMVLVDPALRTAWDFSRFKHLGNGSLQASRIAIWDLNGPGWKPPFEGKRWWMHGARGSGMPLLGGLVRPEEVESGTIRHALAFAAPSVRRSSVTDGPKELCSPVASRTDGVNYGIEFIPEGARLQLDPTLDLDALGLAAPTKVIARAMQVYGLFLADQGKTFKIYLQNLGPGDNEWHKFGLFSDLKRIPVTAFRVLHCELHVKN